MIFIQVTLSMTKSAILWYHYQEATYRGQKEGYPEPNREPVFDDTCPDQGGQAGGRQAGCTCSRVNVGRTEAQEQYVWRKQSIARQ